MTDPRDRSHNNMRTFVGHNTVHTSSRSCQAFAGSRTPCRTQNSRSACTLHHNPSNSSISAPHRVQLGCRQQFCGRSLPLIQRCASRRPSISMTVSAVADGGKPRIGWLGLGTLGTPMVKIESFLKPSFLRMHQCMLRLHAVLCTIHCHGQRQKSIRWRICECPPIVLVAAPRRSRT